MITFSKGEYKLSREYPVALIKFKQENNDTKRWNEKYYKKRPIKKEKHVREVVVVRQLQQKVKRM